MENTIENRNNLLVKYIQYRALRNDIEHNLSKREADATKNYEAVFNKKIPETSQEIIALLEASKELSAKLQDKKSIEYQLGQSRNEFEDNDDSVALENVTKELDALSQEITQIKQDLKAMNDVIQVQNEKQILPDLIAAMDKLTPVMEQYRGVDNFFLNADLSKLPDDVISSMTTVADYVNANKGQVASLTKTVMPIIELYKADAVFVSAMNNDVDIEKLIKVGKKTMPKFFKSHLGLEDVLRHSYGSYDSALKLPIGDLLDNNISSSIAIMRQQFASPEFDKQFNQTQVNAVNFDLISEFRTELEKRVKGKNKKFVLGNHGEVNLAAQFVKPMQYSIRYKDLLEGVSKRHNECLQTPIENLGEKLTAMNKLKDTVDAGGIAVVDLESEGLKHIAEALDAKNARKKVLGEVDKVVSSLTDDDSNKTSASTQLKGYKMLIDELSKLKEKHETINSIDELKSFPNEIKVCIEKVKNVHPKFKVGKLAKIILNRMSKFAHQASSEITNVVVIKNTHQLDTVQNLQLNFLDELIKDLECQVERINKKVDVGKSEKHLQKQKGLQGMLTAMEKLKSDFAGKPKVEYTNHEANFKQTVMDEINKQKKSNPLLTKGLFSTTKKLLKKAETQAEDVQEKLYKSVNNPKKAEAIRKKMDKENAKKKKNVNAISKEMDKNIAKKGISISP